MHTVLYTMYIFPTNPTHTLVHRSKPPVQGIVIADAQGLCLACKLEPATHHEIDRPQLQCLTQFNLCIFFTIHAARGTASSEVSGFVSALLSRGITLSDAGETPIVCLETDTRYGVHTPSEGTCCINPHICPPHPPPATPWQRRNFGPTPLATAPG